MAVRKFVFLDETTGQYKEQTSSDTISVANGTEALHAVNKSQLDAISSASTSAVAAEQARALAAEAAIQAEVDAEESRALAAEQNLQGQITAEVGRATQAEADIAADLAAEIASRTAADAAESAARAAAVSAEQTRALAAEAAIEADLAAEESARIAAVSAEAAARAAAVSAEKTRAELVEAGLQSAIDSEISNRVAAVSAEKSRAEAAEAALQGDLDVLNGADTLSGSVAYAVKTAKTALEASIASEQSARIAADATLTSDLDAEEARALAAEQALGNRIDTEITDRAAAVLTLTVDLNNEIGRAQLAESGLASSINSEISRAQAVESGLQGQINAEVTRAQAMEDVIAANLATETIDRVAGDASTLADAKAYADGLSTGLKFKDSVRVALPTSFEFGGASVSLPADFSSIVGETDLVAGDRLLLISPDETTGAVASGIYVVAAGGVSIVRSSDMKLGDDVSGAYVYVEEGDFTPGSSAKGTGTAYVCSSIKGSDIVGSGALKWAIFSRMENLTFANGFSKTGQEVSAVLKSDGAVGVGGSGFFLKLADNEHLETVTGGLQMKGSLVDGSNADSEHHHANIMADAAFGAAVGTFVKFDGLNASFDAPAVFGFVESTANGTSKIVLSGVVEKSAAAFAAGDQLYLNNAGNGFVTFGNVPTGKYAIPVGRKLDGTKIFVQIGTPVLKA